MRPNTALALAIVFGLSAVGLVTAETAYGLEAKLEAQDGAGQWHVVSTYEGGEQMGRLGPFSYDTGCYGPRFRITVDNHKPFGDTVEVVATVHNRTSGLTETLLSETWSLAAFDVRQTELEVEPDGFDERDPSRNKVVYGRDLQVRVGEQIYLSACVPEVGA